MSAGPREPERDWIEAWMGGSGTEAECTCGWRSSSPVGVLPDAVLAAAEAHCVGTGHHWPTGESEVSA